MASPTGKSAVDLQEMQDLLHALEMRIGKIEEHLEIEEGLDSESGSIRQYRKEADAADAEEEDGIEFKIGQFGLAWLGSIVILIGIAFSMTYTYSKGYSVLPSLLGYLAAAGFWLVAHRWRESLPHLSKMLKLVSFLLLYYTSLRLHYFAEVPLIGSKLISTLLIVAVIIVQIYFAMREQSELLTGFALLTGFTTALFIDSTHITLPFIVTCSGISVILFMQRSWARQMIATLVLAYAGLLLWLLNNPLMGHPLQAVSSHQYNFVYLFAIAALYSLPTIRTYKAAHLSSTVVALTLLNGGGFSVLGLIEVVAFFQNNFVWVSLAVALFFLGFSMLQWQRTHRQFEPAFYACFGFMALTIAVFGYTKIPFAYFWLSLQSLLVVSMALWYRSKIIVVVNTFIYASILLAYLVTSPSVDMVNLSLALTALASARVMNWKKERLTLRTEMLRNIYLVSAFFVVLYGLHRAVPQEYVTVSWTLAAIVYFALSLLLSSIKYRYMAILTIIAAVIYLFVVDLARLEAGYRVIAFISLGLILLAVSLFYTKFRHRLKRRQLK